MNVSPKIIFSKYAHGSISQPENQVDIGKLSRVEKEVVSRFLPLVEYLILKKLALQFDGRPFSDIVVLMDMPGLRLPSQLQSLLLEYVRSVMREENEYIQFILVTRSSLLRGKATSEELFMLKPSEQLVEDSNQLMKVSDAKMFLMHF
jgi:hypothetical protein